MSPFHREPMSYDFLLMFCSNYGYISCREKYRDLEIRVKSQSRSLKLVPFDRQ